MNDVSPEIDLEQIDEQSRRRVFEDLDECFLVEAAAGTGKTTSIVGRMVNLIATGRCEIGRLAAMTFTRKAAAELRERFCSEVYKQSTSSDRSEDQRIRLAVAANNIQDCFLGTYHAFCAMLLRERPIEANVDPQFRELEQPEVEQLIDDAWFTFIAALHDENSDHLTRLRELGMTATQLKPSFAEFVDNPDIECWPHTPSEDFDRERLCEQLVEYLNDIAAMRVDFPKDRQTDELMDHYEAMLRKSRHVDWKQDASVFELVEMFAKSTKCTQMYWSLKSIGKRERDRYESFRESMAKPAMQWWKGKRYQFLVELFGEASEVLDKLRRTSGGLSFTDLLTQATRALRRHPELRRYFADRFSCLLVDEFQDTDPIQAELLSLLAADDPNQTDWKKCRLRPGSLFVVGDPKQSIYRFRRADIVTYGQMKSVFAQSGGEVLSLLKNFRSVDELIRWNNETYEDLIGTTETEFSPAAFATVTGRDDATTTDQLSGIKRLSVAASRKPDQARLDEADKIARYIRHALDTKAEVPRTSAEIALGLGPAANPSDFLIIAWQKHTLQDYAEALDRYGVPCEVTGSNALGAIVELGVLTDVLRSIDDASNAIAYTAVLRGGVFGFTDDDLYQYRKAGGRFDYRSAVPDGIDVDLKRRFELLHERFKTYAGWLRRIPFSSAAERIASDLGLIARTTISPSQEITTGGFYKAIQWIRFHAWQFDATKDMISYLEELTESSEAEPVSATGSPSSMVRIMNLHKVKGLEASVVFLAGVHGDWNPAPKFHVSRSNDQVEGYFTIRESVSKWSTRELAEPSGWATAENQEQRFLDAEHNRLLYVATTRARSQMIVSQRDDGKNAKSRWKSLDRYLDSADEIEVPEIEPKSVCPIKPTSTTISVDLEKRWQQLLNPSYQVVAAKTLAMKGQHRPKWHASGDYGHRWGSVVHELLESKMRHPSRDQSQHVYALIEEYGLAVDRAGELLSTVESVIGSSIWKRAMEAPRRYVEIPFDVPKTREDLPTIVSGVIDLVFEQPDGWAVVDYKTDDISIDQVGEAVDYYRPQLDHYAQTWSAITGFPVVEKGLYFTKVDRYEILGERS